MSVSRARKAEARLASFMRRNDVPPLSARHLQEAIVGSTLMYGTEVTWQGQGFMQDSIQKAINRMMRSSLGVLRSTPVAFLEAIGGSMPAGPRPDMRQASYAGRVMGAESEGIRAIGKGRGALAGGLRESLRGTIDPDLPSETTRLEVTSPLMGLRFPGQIRIPEAVSGEQEKIERIRKAIDFAKDFESDPRSFWTDGSALPGGVGAGAVVGFVEGYVETDPDRQRVVKEREGIVGCGRRTGKPGRRGGEATYRGEFRSFIRFGSERGMRAEAWSLKGGVTVFDAELSTLVRGIELCLLRTTPGAAFNIFTDSQAAMLRLRDDRSGPGQQMAVRGIRVAREAINRGASITISWVPGHAAVPGNEVADQWAVDAAMREFKSCSGRDAGANPPAVSQYASQAFLKQYLVGGPPRIGERRSQGREAAGDRTGYRRKGRSQGFQRGYRGQLGSWRLDISS